MRKQWAIFLMIGVVSLFSSAFSLADENSENQAPSSENSGSVLKKLDKIEANQEQILKQLEEIKAELYVVKMRISSN